MKNELYAVNGEFVENFWDAVTMAGKLACAGQEGTVYKYSPGQYDDTQDIEVVVVVRARK